MMIKAMLTKKIINMIPLTQQEIDLIPLGNTYDDNGNKLTYKNFDGYCHVNTYDDNNKILTYKNSDGYLGEYTYDDNNKILAHKNSNGVNITHITNGEEYKLKYDLNTKLYIAGCKALSYDDCLKFYVENKAEFVDADLFIKAIKSHNKTLQTE